jgi:hypothetical protein
MILNSEIVKVLNQMYLCDEQRGMNEIATTDDRTKEINNTNTLKET